ncbi:MAG: sugar phosphate isomerase/epimerase family protein [Planctomycetota bacterium]
MKDLRIGIRTLCLGQPLRRALQTAARIEAQGVQIDLRTELPLADCSATALREVRKLLDDHGLRVASAAYPTRRGFGEEADLSRRVAAAMQAMSVAAQLGARVLVVRVGPPSGAGGVADALRESLTTLGRHGDHVGVRLATQTVGDPADLAGLIQCLPEGALAVDLHPAELLRHGHSAVDVLTELGQHVAHVTAADAVQDLADRRVVDVTLGRGVVDFATLLAGLAARDYRGWVTVDRQNSPQPAAELADAVAYLRAVLRD